MPDEITPEQALVAAAMRLGVAWGNAERDPKADSASDTELASDLLALAARDRTREVEALPADQRPVGWDGKDDDAPLPDGFYGRIELPGYRDDTGWITEESRFGAQAAVVRDWDGREVGIYFIGPACRIVALATPLKRPDPEGPQAITGSAWPVDEDSDWTDPVDGPDPEAFGGGGYR